ncbi:MAG: hypothetical protein K2R98_08560 [Gemmataceae bacterium]|nr:hypothetical protein [Gemmataceae bacterium]
MLNAKIDIAASGQNQIVAAVAGKKIRVVNYLIVAAGAVTAKFQSKESPTDLTGAMTMAAGQPIGSAYSTARQFGGYDGHFETQTGEGLAISLGGAVQVSGHLNYVLVT